MDDAKKRLVLSLLAYCVQRDVPADQLGRLSGIDIKSLIDSKPYSVSQMQLTSLWMHASSLTRDANFGLHFGESLQLAALGSVGEIIRHSHTIGAGVNIAASLTPLLTDLFTIEVQHGENSFTISLQDTAEARGVDDSYKRHLADMLIVFVVHELDGLILEKIRPMFFTLPPELSVVDEYKRVLRCTDHRIAELYSLTFDRKYWDVPILASDHELQAMLIDKARQAVPELMIQKTSFHHSVEQYLLTNSYLGVPTLEEVAANFNITSRTLQRKLKEERISFQDIADTVRKDMALHYLQAGKYQLKEISHMLGYHDLSAFSRAFKRWTGKAPAYYSTVGLQ